MTVRILSALALCAAVASLPADAPAHGLEALTGQPETAPTAGKRPAGNGDSHIHEDELHELIEEIIAEQIAPLRAQLEAYEDTVRLRDVIGGLGYILGLTGLAAWFRRRR